MDVMKTGKLIAAARKERGLTQKELADALRVSDRAVSKWERGLNLPNAEIFEPLCETLDLSVTELLRGERLDRPEASIEDFRQAVDDAVALAKKQERTARWHKRTAILVVCALVLAVAAGQLFMAARESYRRQAACDEDHAQPSVYLKYYDGVGTWEACLLQGGHYGPFCWERPNWLIDELPLTVERPADWKIIALLDLSKGSDLARFYMVGGKSEMTVEVLRWPVALRGTGAGFAEAETVPYYGDPGRYYEDVCTFELEPGYIYSIVVRWGDGYFREYSFGTTA